MAWPLLFKFIVPSGEQRIEQVREFLRLVRQIFKCVNLQMAITAVFPLNW